MCVEDCKHWTAQEGRWLGSSQAKRAFSTADIFNRFSPPANQKKGQPFPAAHPAFACASLLTIRNRIAVPVESPVGDC